MAADEKLAARLVQMTVEEKLDAIIVLLMEQRRAFAQPAAVGPAVAPDRDLDSQYGDEKIKKDPPRWKKADKESHTGKTMSECPPDYLDAYADFKDWAADNDEQKASAVEDAEEKAKKLKYARYGRMSAARARGWAARIRGGWKMPGAAEAKSDDEPGDGKDDW